jgi:hypothetical protein
MANEDNQTRMNNIMHIDTPALLKTLKELESQLSQYQRQDKIPKWAEAIMPRLELVETGVKNIMVPQRAAHTEAVTLKDLEQEEIFSDKIKHIVDGRTESLKLMFDSKISSSALELDRLHKLLYIRPTTSELQQVMMQVREVESKVNKVHGDVSGSIQSIVQEQLTNEMESMSERLRAAEAHSNKAVELVLSKVDDVEGDVRRVRDGTKGEFGELLDGLQQVKDQEANMKKSIDVLEENLKSVDDRCHGALEGLGRQIEDMAAANADTETAANERMDGIEDNIAAGEENLKDEIAKNDDRFDELQYGIASMGEKLDELKKLMIDQIEGVKTNQENLSGMLEKTIERQTAIQEYVTQLEKFQPIVKISDNMEAIQHLQDANHTNVQTTNIIKQDIKEILSDQSTMQEALEDVPNIIQVESLKIDSANKEIAQLKDGHKYTKTELSKHTGQLDDLSVLKVDMIMVKGVSEAQDDRIKKMTRQVVEAGENLENQERRLDNVVLEQDVKDENVMNTIESVKSEFDQKMENQAAEIEAKVEVLRDTVVNGTGNSVQGSSMKTGSRTMKKNLKSNMGKISDDSSAKRIIEMIEEEDGQKQETAEDMVINETADKIEYLAQLSLNFEEIASFRNAVPRDVPNSICYDIAACAQAVAQVVAETADLQAIQKMVRGAPQDIVYEDAVTQKRNSCLEQVMADLKGKLREHHPDAGLLRLEARDMFLSRTYHAFQLAISKFDQVLTTGHTRLGRVSVPSCIACDRPLLAKAPRQMSDNNGGGKGGGGGGGGGGFVGGSSQYTSKNPLAPIGHVANPNQSFFEPTQSSTFGTQVGSLDEELDALQQSSYANPSRGGGGGGGGSAVRLPAPRSDLQQPELEGDNGKTTRGKETAHYVKRGGFKMPPKLPQLSQSGPAAH